MAQKVTLYRVVSAGRLAGEWRDTRGEARGDATKLGLGSYDEYGQWFDTVPGRINWIEVTPAEAERLLKQS